MLALDGLPLGASTLLVLLGRTLAGFSALGNPLSMAWAGAALPKETRSSAIMYLTLNILYPHRARSLH